MWICITVGVLMVACTSMVVLPISVMASWLMDIMLWWMMSVVNDAMSIVLCCVFCMCWIVVLVEI